jgi:hypothetical protein
VGWAEPKKNHRLKEPFPGTRGLDKSGQERRRNSLSRFGRQGHSLPLRFKVRSSFQLQTALACDTTSPHLGEMSLLAKACI